MPSEEEVLNALRKVEDPDLGRDIVSLGFVKNLQIEGGEIRFDLELTTPACPVKDRLRRECEEELKGLKGVSKASVNLTSRVRTSGEGRIEALAQVKNVVAVASGKGGVGKSTVAANLALALAETGAKAGLLDADIYGPSVPIMFGLKQMPMVDEFERIIPLERYGIQLMSIGFLSENDAPVIWRGPLVHGAIQQFLTRTAWNALDYLVIDLPPGTGDVQLTLAQSSVLSGALIVTTPQEVSVVDARKGLKMFEKVKVPVLGIVENMCYYICSGCGKRADLFRSGGGKRAAESLNVPFLGEIPIDEEIAESGDQGIPIVVKNPASSSAQSYRDLAGRVAARLSILGGGKAS